MTRSPENGGNDAELPNEEINLILKPGDGLMQWEQSGRPVFMVAADKQDDSKIDDEQNMLVKEKFVKHALDVYNGGIAIDIPADPERLPAVNDKAYKWLMKNADGFGALEIPGGPWHGDRPREVLDETDQ